ncbi:MMPL family transporter [Clostridium sp. C8-1-8]|uniref:MMPL family transporter n=1 Tax=Clostridium sp. C8-1-8 TaxID=2698831 RepID=UPI00136BE4F2|nr:MMPL family transporter [Clostridium sp. C8-1-8]
MRKMLKFRWVLLALWAVATVLFTINQPNLKQILNQKGQASISEDSPSKLASEMINKMGTSKGDTAIFVFNDPNKISDDGMKDIEKGIDKLKDKKTELKINNIVDPFGTPEAKDQMISKDGTTLITQVTYERGTRDSETIVNSFKDALKDVKTTHYITGELAINNDYLEATNKGVDKSAFITVGFILVVLMLMFRSVVTPFVSLLAVGVSYLCSMGIIGVLINAFNFPITSLTQMFIILVLFGIGTDYNILLFNRFKEELGHGLSIDEAVVVTYKTAGKTVIFSGLTVFMAFASLTFVSFPIYRSANAVAIGIAVLLIELVTLTPVIMKLLAKKLFWPSHNVAGHKENKLWEKVTSASVKHPLISVLVVAAIIAPVIAFNSTKLSFDSLKDLSADTPSVKGFTLVADKFGRGKAMPTTVVIENKDAMDNNEALSVIDELTVKLKGLKGIQQVSSVTQPKGDAIENFYTNSQTKTVVDGLGSANNGVGQINDGMKKIETSLTTPDFSSVKELSTGTGAIQNGMGAVTDGLKKISDGIDQGANGADKLTGGIAGVKDGVSKINGGLQTIHDKLAFIQQNYVKLGEGYKGAAGSIPQLKQLVTMINGVVASLEQKLPANDPDIAKLRVLMAQLSGGLDGLSKGINAANANYDQLTNGLSALNDGINQIIANTSSNSELVQGIAQLEQGEAGLAAGLRQGSAGQKTVIENMAKLQDGAGKIKDGQDKLYAGLTQLTGGLGQLKDGISKSSDGLGTIHDGINKTNDFLTQLTTGTKSFYIPKEAFEKSDLTKMFDTYMSSDRKITKITINLDSDPYAKESIKTIDEINELVKNQLKGTKLSDAKFGVAGPTATTNDLNNIATHDITFTQIIVLAAIFVLLVLVIRSFWIPVYIVGSLVAAYYTAISVTSFLTSKLFSNVDGMSWNVPFFSFVVIAALGVDYSIFLMTRFKEYPNTDPKEAIILAAKNVGGVVMSAAIILAGTFATLYPSNIHVLMELAICVVTGLFLLSVVLLPIVIPALISIAEKISRKADQSFNSESVDNEYIA